jgi:AcrR family transcriptional regulator
MGDNSDTRPYRMTRRAAATAETRAAILDATFEIGDPRAPLSAIAARAGISERTVLRHFGSRDGLVAAAIVAGTERVERERFDVPAGDVGAAVANLVGHYEEAGDRVFLLLGEEGADETIDAILVEGRKMHRRWVREKLGPLLGERSAGERRLRIAQLVAVCDVYTWKLLRRDSGLSRAATERAIAELIGAVVELESEDR